MSKLDELKKKAEAAKASGDYLRLAKDGEKATVVFCGEPEIRDVHWDGSGYVAYDPEQHNSKATRFAVNVYNVRERKVQIWDGSLQTATVLVAVSDKYGLNYIYELKRHGDKGDSRTTYTILPERPLKDIEKAKVAHLELFDLAEVSRQAEETAQEERAPEHGGEIPPIGDEDIPF